MTSLTWLSSIAPSTDTIWTSICSANNIFVAVGKGATIGVGGAAAYSDSTGLSWTLSTNGVYASSIWQSVCYGNGLFVAVSSGVGISSPIPLIMYSSDGINWNSSGISYTYFDGLYLSAYENWSSISYNGTAGDFIAVSSLGGDGYYNVMISNDMSSSGGTWNLYPIQSGIDLRSSCVATTGNFLAVGEGVVVFESSTFLGFTVESGSTPISNCTWTSVCYGNGIFMAIGYNSTSSTSYCMTSPDGTTWTQQSIPSSDTVIWNAVCYGDNGTEQVFVVTDNNQYVTSNNNGTSWTPSPPSTPALTPSGSWLSVAYNPTSNYFASLASDAINPQGMYAVLCFKEGSKILTDKGYVEIQNLRKGDSVQTLKDGFKKIVFLGKRIIDQNSLDERIKDQLYRYSSKEYPELFEDLVLTGGHSILVDSLTEEERENMRITMFDLFKGEDFEIDDKKCLLSYLNNKAEVYEKKGKHTIYHFALEGDYYKNYGVYANGLLVEACSQHIFLEYVHPDTTFCQRTLFYLVFILTHLSDITEFIKSKSMGLLKMRRKLKNEKDSFSEFHSVF